MATSTAIYVFFAIRVRAALNTFRGTVFSFNTLGRNQKKGQEPISKTREFYKLPIPPGMLLTVFPDLRSGSIEHGFYARAFGSPSLFRNGRSRWYNFTYSEYTASFTAVS